MKIIQIFSKDAPEFMPKGKEVEAGVYLVKVFSPDNLGKYVFVVGEKEEFPAGEIINTVEVLPKFHLYTISRCGGRGQTRLRQGYRRAGRRRRRKRCVRIKNPLVDSS